MIPLHNTPQKPADMRVPLLPRRSSKSALMPPVRVGSGSIQVKLERGAC